MGPEDGGYSHEMTDGPRVCVFAPSPILTVTIETVADDGVPEIHLHAGGQGVWIARLLAELDVHVVLCCALGGETGGVLRGLLDASGIELVAVDGGRNGAYVHDRAMASDVRWPRCRTPS